MPQEILPPLKTKPLATAMPEVPAVYNGGIVDSWLSKLEHRSQSKAVAALTEKQNALAANYGSVGNAVEQYGRLREKMEWLAELPRQLEHNRAMQHLSRVEAYAAQRRVMQLAEEKHQHDLLQVQTRTVELQKANTLATVALVDAEQQLEAKRKYGASVQKLVYQGTMSELLSVELETREKRRLLYQEMEMEEPEHPPPDTEILQRLYAARNEFRASGGNTDQLDAVIRILTGK